MRGSNWSRDEVEAAVADYFRMLSLELLGQRYSKAEHRRALLGRLSKRTEGAIELKHQNISAVLLELGSVFIPGYKPMGNYQQLLWEVVVDRLKNESALQRTALEAVERSAEVPRLESLQGILVDPPRVARVRDAASPPPYKRKAIRCDYLEREAKNRSLGLAGEQFVAEFEARRLHAAGFAQLSSRVEHVASTQGDGLGYDVLSFEATGRERFIEVKTTAFAATTPFYISRNELSFSDEQPSQFVLARVHEFRGDPKFYEIKGSLSKSLRLDAVTFLARLQG